MSLLLFVKDWARPLYFKTLFRTCVQLEKRVPPGMMLETLTDSVTVIKKQNEKNCIYPVEILLLNAVHA